MASSSSEIVKDLVQVLEGASTELVKDLAAKATKTTTVSSSSSISISAHSSAAEVKASVNKPSLFFKFGQAIADVAVTLVCCACNKGQQNISAQVDAKVDEAQVQTAPKPK